LASFLRDIVCYDLKANAKVKYGNTGMVRNYPDHTLMLCWPPYDTSMAYNALTAYEGEHLIYIGEAYGGGTGGDAFHEELKNWEEVVRYNIPRRKYNDVLTIYGRKDHA